MMKDVVIRVKYGSGSVDVRITDQDELKISSGGTPIASWLAPQGDQSADRDSEEAMSSQCTGSKCAGWTGTKAYGGSGTATEGGSPNIMTVKRLGTRWKRSISWKWKVEFAFGGAITIWATKTQEDNKKYKYNRNENVMLWMWLQIPTDLKSAGSGLCTTYCSSNVGLPYEWCQGTAACLPVRVEDTIVWTTAEITALETGCGVTAGTSQRPNTCKVRPVTDVDCGQTQQSAGGFFNWYQDYKWPKNLGIRNNRNSGGTGTTGDIEGWSSRGCGGSGCTEETYTGVYGFNDMAEFSPGAHQDGFCDSGSFCRNEQPDGSFRSPSCIGRKNCCKNTNPGGGGGHVEDLDCPYDYEFRDFAPWDSKQDRGGFPSAGAEKWGPRQDCWDWCSYYTDPNGMPHRGLAMSGTLEQARMVEEEARVAAGLEVVEGGGNGVKKTGKNRCAIRNKLKKGGQMYCGYTTGKYSSYALGSNHPYSGRCALCVSSKNILNPGSVSHRTNTRGR